MNIQLVTTSDGSHTLFVKELKEHYHSTFGAMQESAHIFINAGFKSSTSNQKQINILEVGFGTGLNAFLSCIETISTKVTIHYTTIESNPLAEEITSLLNYPQYFHPSIASIFSTLHSCPWNEEYKICDLFTILKIENRLEKTNLQTGLYDLIYFDAFGPDVQPELWTEDIFEKIYLATRKDGILITYSAKGSVRRALKNAGFSVEKLPGPPGKREITRAIK